MWETNMIAGKRSEVGESFKKGSSRRNYSRSTSQISLMCTGTGRGSFSTDRPDPSDENNDNAENNNELKALPSLVWSKSSRNVSNDGRFGMKSSIGNDVTFAKGGSRRFFPSPVSQIQLITNSVESVPESLGDTGSTIKMAQSTSSDSTCADSVCHGKSSNVGFESTFAKGGSRRNYATSDNHFPLPCLLASKFTADEDSLDVYSQDYVPPISPTAYPIQYDHVPVEMSQSFGRRSNIGNDVTFSKGGSRRIFAGPRSQINISGNMGDEDNAAREVDYGMRGSSLRSSSSLSPSRAHSSSPTAQMWPEAVSENHGFGRRSFMAGTATLGGSSPSRRGQRRNYSAPDPHVSLKSLDAQCTRDMGDMKSIENDRLQEEKDKEKEKCSQEERDKVLRDAVRTFSEKSAATAAWHRTHVINGVKSTVGLTIFTGGHRKLFHHPESQISLSPVFDKEKRLDYGEGQCLDGKGRRNYIGGERLHISIS